jgi:hypothetical protein
MGIRTCFHCGKPVLDTADTCPDCGADLRRGVETAAGGITSSGDWDDYDMPLLDISRSFRLLGHPGDVDARGAEAAARKYGGFSLIFSTVGLLLAFVPIFSIFGALPALLGIVWGLMVARVTKKAGVRTGRAAGMIGLALGLVAMVVIGLRVLTASG